VSSNVSCLFIGERTRPKMRRQRINFVNGGSGGFGLVNWATTRNKDDRLQIENFYWFGYFCVSYL
jgi:hypothetical protein